MNNPKACGVNHRKGVVETLREVTELTDEVLLNKIKDSYEKLI